MTARVRTILLSALLALITIGCGLGRDPVIDTWPIGEVIDCVSARCEEEVRVALVGLAARDPGHAAVVSTRLHNEGALFDPGSGNQVLMTRSGACCHVLVAELADGTTRAIGVGYPGISPTAVAIPWEIAPGG